MMKVDFLKDYENKKVAYCNPEMEDFLDSGDEASEKCFKQAFVIANISGWDPVLITGPNGTGKSGYAKLLWNECSIEYRGVPEKGKEKDIHIRKMDAMNCGAIPDNLIDTELFGYKKGAFTGANEDRKGRIMAAAQGSHCLFLDEVGELPLQAQARLLRFFQNKEIQPVGGNCEKLGEKEKLKVICATNKDLDKEVEEGRFRLDLLNRIRKYHVEIPPLKDRPNDCATNFKNFFENFKKKMKENNGETVPSWLSSMEINEEDFKEENRECEYPWPGNFRELQNRLNDAIVKKLIDQDDGAICFENLFPEGIQNAIAQANRLLKKDEPGESNKDGSAQVKWGLPDLSTPLTEFNLEEKLDEIRQKYIDKAVKQKGSKTKAAKLLGYENYQKMDRKRAKP